MFFKSRNNPLTLFEVLLWQQVPTTNPSGEVYEHHTPLPTAMELLSTQDTSLFLQAAPQSQVQPVLGGLLSSREYSGRTSIGILLCLKKKKWVFPHCFLGLKPHRFGGILEMHQRYPGQQFIPVHPLRHQSISSHTAGSPGGLVKKYIIPPGAFLSHKICLGLEHLIWFGLSTLKSAPRYDTF